MEVDRQAMAFLRAAVPVSAVEATARRGHPAKNASRDDRRGSAEVPPSDP